MKKIMMTTIAVAGAALLTTGVMAQDGKSRGHGGWDRMDVNGDGELTADEMAEKHAALIEAADADGNGAVSKEEMKAYHQARRDEHRAKRSGDANGDGAVDRTEYLNAAQTRFDKMDKDGDGVLSEDEQRRKRGHRRGGNRGE